MKDFLVLPTVSYLQIIDIYDSLQSNVKDIWLMFKKVCVCVCVFFISD